MAAASATESTAPEAGAAVEPSFLRDTFGDDAELIGEILGDFLKPADGAIGEILAAIEARSARGVEMAAHQRMSASRTIGAMPLAELCRRLEEAGTSGDWDEIEATAPKLTAAMAEVQAYLKAL